MRPESFTYLQGVMRQHAAVVLEEGKEYLVSARLGPLARREGWDTVDNLVAQLRSQPFGALHRQVVHALVTTETSFFRDIHPFESLRDVVFPELIAKRRLTRSLNIWSAACSSGQEPYSIAMLIREHVPALAGWSVRILASDLSSGMIDRARSGTYSQLEINRGIPVRLLTKYFERSGVHWVVSDEIRRMVEFRELNLAEPLPSLPAMDVVFLRNVLIYFSEDNRRRILERVAEQLRPDGYLFVGSAETMITFENLFRRVRIGQTSAYQVRQR